LFSLGVSPLRPEQSLLIQFRQKNYRFSIEVNHSHIQGHIEDYVSFFELVWRYDNMQYDKGIVSDCIRFCSET
jgi:hypothetical protein